MKTTYANVLRSEIFQIENPEVSVQTTSDDVRVLESPDSRCHIEVSGNSEKAQEFADLIEITANGRGIDIKVGYENKRFWRNFAGRSHDLNILIKLPKASSLKARLVSANIEIAQRLENLRIESVSGDISVIQNPTSHCEIKSISGDITTRTFSSCHYSLKTVSGDITVHVAPGLEIDMDGKSVSGDMESEIALDSHASLSASDSDVVVITATTISGDFVLARNLQA